MTIKCALCGSEKLPTICQFHDEYMPLCCDCVGFSWPQIVAKLYRKVKELELKLDQSLNRSCTNCKYTAKSIADEPCCNCDQTKGKWEPQ